MIHELSSHGLIQEMIKPEIRYVKFNFQTEKILYFNKTLTKFVIGAQFLSFILIKQIFKTLSNSSFRFIDY
jgi:hypothetical protein